ncbi:hypothetical protein UFOVP87_5 [uncultured Caudovirales phage]|uniref:Uncharacterized protein n=1 Tax=uncultured Caudovirales phage TaxID=2100421 RepID=A0A6J5KW70_9CAUD|nr:hypothetical protein UFOVP87_5 [uncultured Caudovirales phage]
MSIEGEKVRFALRRALESINPKFNKACKVKSVSADTITGLMTCDVVIIEDNTVLEDVRLSADFNENTTSAGLILVPKVDSIVLVSFLGDSEAYLSMVSEIDCMYLNGNTFGGMIKIDDLTSSINTMINNINIQLTAISAGIATGGGSYTPTPLTLFNKVTYENTKVNHGNGSLA